MMYIKFPPPAFANIAKQVDPYTYQKFKSGGSTMGPKDSGSNGK